MNHKVKTRVLKAIDLLPPRWGDALYHGLQTFTARSPRNEYEYQQPTLATFVRILESLGLDFKGRDVVEVGSGWLPVLPYDLVFKQGARSVQTFDINKHYLPGAIARFNQFYGQEFGVQLSNTLPDQVTYFPYTDICQVSMRRGSVGGLITRNVLEHVYPEILEKIHRQAVDYLRDDGFIIHQISPSDHRAYSDQSLSLWDFLQYSEAEWNSIQTRFDYHNRLRLPQYLDVFTRCGLEVAHLSFKPARPSQMLPEKIHEYFKGYTMEELTAGNIIVVLKPVRR